MSKYTGQCDFYDLISIQGGFEDFNNIRKYNIYIGKSLLPLVFNNIQDLEPYYCYGVCASGINNVENTGTIRLTKEPLREW